MSRVRSLAYALARRRELDRVDVLLTMSRMDIGTQVHGLELSRLIGMRPGRCYVALHGLLERGVLVDGWSEQPDGPPRRFYVLLQHPMDG